MGEEAPSKIDIASVFKKLRSFAGNKVCFDCGAKNPTWASVTYGVFICIDCSAIHRGLGVHLSFVRSTQLDTNWTWLQLRAMQVGGNANATQFFGQHGVTGSDALQKYKSRAAQLYREKLHHLAAGAMRMHGTKLHIEHDQLSPVGKDVDFFDVHTAQDLENNSLADEAFMIPHGIETANGQPASTIGPSVDQILDGTAPAATATGQSKSSIGQRKPAKAGAKKGLGAQKVSTNFSEVEKEAEILEKQRDALASQALSTPFAAKSDASSPDVQQLSARLMMQDINQQQSKAADKWRQDPKKSEQAERLGMAFTGPAKGGVGHSVGSSLREIQQEGGGLSKSSSGAKLGTRPDYSGVDDDWEILQTQPSSKGTRATSDDKFGFGGTASWSSAPSREPSMWSTEIDDKPKAKPSYDVAPTNEAQTKFKNAKAISSDQFFGDRGPDFETRTTLSRFEGSNAISSSDFFGGGAPTSRNAGASAYGGNYQMPDVAEIKDSVRVGVTKVAGKLSALSSSVQTYISDNYGS